MAVGSGSAQARAIRDKAHFTSAEQTIKNFVIYFALSSVCTNFAEDRVIGAFVVTV